MVVSSKVMERKKSILLATVLFLCSMPEEIHGKSRNGVITRSPTALKMRCINRNPSDVRSNEARRETCCRVVYKGISRNWYTPGQRLGADLNALKLWNCTQLQRECADRTFAFSEYTQMLYLRFCDENAYVERCGMSNDTSVNETTTIALGEGSGSKGYLDSTVEYLTEVSGDVIRSKAVEKLLQPCTQVSAITEGKTSAMEFYEIKALDIPFCEIVWCALPSYAFREYDISVSACMPKRCRINFFVFMGFYALLSVAIIWANATVLIVFATNRRIMNSQIVYKISIAVADLLSGVIMFPGMIESTRRTFLAPFVEVTRTSVNEKSIAFSKPTEIIDAIGFFTNLSITVSIYTLFTASLDRFFVVFRPLLYDKFKALLAAKISVAVLWILGMLFAALPFFVGGLFYNFVSSFFVLIGDNNGHDAVLVYSIVIALPLVSAWFTNGATFILYAMNSRALVSSGGRQADKNERRLLKTLSIMVGVFTLCLVPLVVTMVVTLVSGGLNYYKPETLDQNKMQISISIEAVTVLIFMSNSLWNFFIYNGRSQEFRTAAICLYKDAFGKLISGRAWHYLLERAGAVRRRFTLRQLSPSLSEQTIDTVTCRSRHPSTAKELDA